MELYEVMRTTAAAREFTADPVSDEAVATVLDNARFAASGGNRQGWRVIVVRSEATRKALAGMVEPVAKRYAAQVAAGEGPWNTIVPTTVDDATIAATPAPDWFLRPLFEAPVLLVVCLDLAVVASVDRYLDRIGVVSGASIYAFVQNLLLSARAEGLAGTLTTAPIAAEPELQALLGIPPHVAVAAVIPLGHPVKRITKLSRRPVSTFATLERYDGPALADPPTA
jgi:nitroreductase